MLIIFLFCYSNWGFFYSKFWRLYLYNGSLYWDPTCQMKVQRTIFKLCVVTIVFLRHYSIDSIGFKFWMLWSTSLFDFNIKIEFSFHLILHLGGGMQIFVKTLTSKTITRLNLVTALKTWNQNSKTKEEFLYISSVILNLNLLR